MSLSSEAILVEAVAEIILAGGVGGSEIVEDRTLDDDRVSGPSKTTEQLVDGLASIRHPHGMTAFALTVASTRFHVAVQTDLVTGPTAVLDVINEIHADHLRGSVHHPPTP